MSLIRRQCWHFSRGFCRMASACLFLHVEAPDHGQRNVNVNRRAVVANAEKEDSHSKSKSDTKNLEVQLPEAMANCKANIIATGTADTTPAEPPKREREHDIDIKVTCNA